VSAPYVHRLRVRFNECDPQGVVFNANWFTYFDVAFNELWRETVGPYGDFTARGLDSVVAEASARFLAPARFDDEVAIALTLTRLGTTGMTTAVSASVGDAVCVEGVLRHVIVDGTTKAKAPIPDDVRAGLGRYAAAAG
jgi:acyl-CoA thioester hydrolase